MSPSDCWGIAIAAVVVAAVAGCRGAESPRRDGSSTRAPPAAPRGTLLVWTSDNDAGDCGEECWGGYSLWEGGRTFRRALRMFSLAPPEISPRRDWIAYTDWGPSTRSYDASSVEIRARPVSWVPAPQLGPSRLLWRLPLYGSAVAWSPDGRSVAVLDSSNRRPKLTVVDVKSGSHRALSTDCVPRSHALNFTHRSIDWSRRGTIAFVGGSRTRATWETYRVRADGSRRCRVLRSAAEPAALAWSPGGGRLLFVRRSSDESGDLLIKVRADGRGARVLRRLSGEDPTCAGTVVCGFEAAAWSPDGRWLAYLTLNSSAVGLWRIGTDDEVVRRLPVALSDRQGLPDALRRVMWWPGAAQAP